jgi:hypothetical protein
VPHAYSFVYHQIMGDQPPPHVPVLFNLFYPPTQPSMSRCIEFGRVLRDAIEAWPERRARGDHRLGRPVALRQ